MPSNECRIDVRVLGTVSVHVDGHEVNLSPVERHLVALLAAAMTDGLDADRLADQLWPDRLPNTWRASLRNNFSRLNKKVQEAHPQDRRLISDRVTNRRLEVDLEAVDLWRLRTWAAEPSDVEAADVEASPHLLAGAPFPNCEISPLLRQATEAVMAARRDIIGAWSEQGMHVSHRLLAELRRTSLQEPYNEPLAECVVELHVALDRHRQARRFLDDLATEAPLPDGLIEVLEHLELDDRPVDLGPSPKRSTFPIHASSISALTGGPFAGRSAMIADLLAAADDGRPGILLHGEAGIGKTRLAAEVATRLGESGYHTAYIVADRHLFGSLQPFLDGLPGLSQIVRPYLHQLHDPNVQAVCRQEIFHHIQMTYSGHPLCLVADDVQWLDDQSGGLLMSFCRAELDMPVFVIGIGRPNEPSGRWASWLSDLGRTGLNQFKVKPLDRADMLELITDRFDPLEQLKALPLADHLLQLSSGIPEVAHWLLDRTDRTRLQIRLEDVFGTGYGAIVGQLEPAAQRCGAVASLLGQQFEVGELAQLGGYEEQECNRQIHELLDSGLVNELPAPGTYRFVHILAAEAFTQTLAAGERARLHAAAFDLTPDLIHRARHAEMAAPIVGEQRAADTLLRAARQFSREGGFRATVGAVERARNISRSTVSLADRVMHLDALERSGTRAGEERQVLVSEALAIDDLDLALLAALSGLPEMEAFEGDPARVRSLQRIDHRRLAPEERMQLHVQLCRQLLLLGRVEEASVQADRARACGDEPDQAAQAWLARRLVDGVGRPMVHDETWPTVENIQSEELRLRIKQAEIVNLIATGRGGRDHSSLLDLADMVPADRFPQLYWFAQMFLVTAATDQGRQEEASARAQRAHRFGLEAGLRIAAGTYETQLFAWEFHKKTHGDLYPVVAEGFADDIAANIVFDAGLAACRYAHSTDESERAQALERVVVICNRAMRSHFDVAAIGILTEPIAATGDTRLMGWANERLATRNGGFTLVASAAANLGPSSGLMAKLQTDRRSRIELQEQAMEEADESNLALWQIISRLELSKTIDPNDAKAARLGADVRELASTDWLMEVVAGHVGGSTGRETGSQGLASDAEWAP